MRPQIDMVINLVRDAAESGRLRSDLTPEAAGLLLHQMVLAAVHAWVLGSGAPSVLDLWRFCAAGIGVPYEDPGLG